MRSLPGFHALLSVVATLVPSSACSPATRVGEPSSQPRSQPAQPQAGVTTLPTAGISRDEQDLIPPGPPGSVGITRRDGSYVVEWNGTRDDTISGYQVYRRRDRGEWVRAGFVAVRADDSRNRGKYDFEDRSEGACEFTVAAVDARGRPGPMTIEIQ